MEDTKVCGSESAIFTLVDKAVHSTAWLHAVHCLGHHFLILYAYTHCSQNILEASVKLGW